MGNSEEKNLPGAGHSDSGRLDAQLRFLLEIDREKEIIRNTYLADGSRLETDAEHAWHLALFAMLLSGYASEPVDRDHVIRMVLIHDLVEVYAGDTYAYDEAGKAGQQDREREAAEKLFSMLPPDQYDEFMGLWEEFESLATPESRFAKSLDRFQPALLNDASGGISWQEHGVRVSQVLKLNEHSAEGSAVLYERLLGLLEKNVRDGTLADDRG